MNPYRIPDPPNKPEAPKKTIRGRLRTIARSLTVFVFAHRHRCFICGHLRHRIRLNVSRGGGGPQRFVCNDTRFAVPRRTCKSHDARLVWY